MSESVEKKYCYSLNEENYYGQYDSVEEAISSAIEDLADEDHDYSEGENREIFIGVAEPCSELLRRLQHWRLADLVIEHLEDVLCDEIAADDHIITPPAPDVMKELGNDIMELVLKRVSFSSYNVKQISKIELVLHEGTWEVVS